MDPMLEAFISESRDLLEAAGRCFLALEQNPEDPEQLNDLFRSMHTIKGSSGLFEIPALTRVVHAAEDVLDVIRDGELRLDSAMIDLFLDAMDQVGTWLDDLEAGGSLGEGAPEISDELSGRLRALLGESPEPATTAPQPQAAPEPESGAAVTASPAVPARVEAPEWLDSVPEAARLALYCRAAGGEARVTVVEYLPDPQCFFSGDDPLLTTLQAPERCWLGVDAREPWPEIAAFDPYQCRLRLRLLSGAGSEVLQEHFRYVPEEVSITELQEQQLVMPAGEPGEARIYQGFLDTAPGLIEAGDWAGLRAAIEPLLELGAPGLYQSSALRWLRAVAGAPGPDAALAAALVGAVATGEFALPEAVEPAVPEGGQPPATEGMRGEVRELLQAQAKLLSLHGEGGFPQGNLQAVARVLRGVLSGLEETALLAEVEQALSLPPAEAATALSRLVLGLLEGEGDTGPAGETEEASQQQAEAMELLQAQKTLLSMPARLETWEGILASAERVIREVLTALGRQDQVASLEQAVALAHRQHGGAPVRELLETICTQLTPRAVEPERPATQGQAPAPATDNGGTGRERRQASTVLKVDQARIDTLMDLVGELVVAKNALPYLARQAEEEFECAPLAKAIKSQYAVINRIAEELQAAVMQVRMVPVSSVFQRFPRLVRDLSRKLDKKIRLVMEGEETEIDKNVVEDLPDPLVHLVRNSIDHGIEAPGEREAAGKPVEGTITLRATQLDDQVLIEVSDDGKGIDPEVIKRKAYEKGLIDEERLDRIDDREALQLILAPGFSTAEQVTDLSGRGVGMDVVNTMVGRIGGSVSVESRPGHGTTIRLALPLSMAVTRVMMVDAGGDSFGVPLEAITETVKVPAEAIRRVKQRELVVLRDRLIPLLYLHRVLELAEPAQPREEVAVLVVRVEGQELGLVVDRFHAGMDVILKPLEGILGGFRQFSGTALLGDGRVLLVLNLMELQRCL